MSSPPIVMSIVTFMRSSDSTVFSRCAGFFVGLAREVPRCEPPRKWMRLTSSMVSGIDVIDVALHEPLEAVLDAQHVDALEGAADRRRADDAVDAGGRTAADQNGDFLRMMHGTTSTRSGTQGLGARR